MTAPAAAPFAEEVVVCEGGLRQIVAGRVVCPHRDAPVRTEDCADCRLLTWRSDDRLQPWDCSTESKQDR